jgi:hypothetical protein
LNDIINTVVIIVIMTVILEYSTSYLSLSFSLIIITHYLIPTGPCLNKMTTDSNAGALDTALDTAIAFADLAPSADVIKYAAGEDCKIFPNVVDKAFQGKSSTIAKYVPVRAYCIIKCHVV